MSKKRLSKALFVIVLFAVAKTSIGQFNETIRTGRPGQSIGAYTIGEGVLQFQTGYNRNSVAEKSLFGLTTLENTYDNVLRYGFLERVEVSLGTAYLFRKINGSGIKVENSGLSKFSVGGRINLIEEKNFLPAFCVQTNVSVPIFKNKLYSDLYAPKFLFSIVKGLTNNLSFNANVILIYESFNFENSSQRYITNFGFAITDNFSVFAEYYLDVVGGTYNHQVDGGGALLITDDFQIDFSAGKNLNTDLGNSWFFDTGFSFRFINK